MAARLARERHADQVLARLKAQYEPRNRLIREVRELRFMERDVYVPAAYQQTTVQVRTPLMNDLVQRLAGALSVNYPQISVPPRPRGDQEKAQRNSSKLEEWTSAFLQEMEHQENDRLFYRFLDYLCADGHAIIKVTHQDELWEQLEELKDGQDPKEYLDDRYNQKTSLPLPFSWKVIDPLTFYPIYGDTGLEEVYEVSKRPKVNVVREFDISGFSYDEKPMFIGRKVEVDSDLSGDCTYVEHWTRKEVEYYINGTLVKVIEHGYDRVPYFHAMGTQTSSREPDKEGLSVGHQLRYIIPALDSLFSMKTNAAFIQSYPAFKRERDMGAPGPRPIEDTEDVDGDSSGEEFEPGHIYEGLPGERLEAIQIPGVGKDVDESIMMLLGLVDRVGVPSVLAGMHTPNRVSGYAYSEMLNVSRTKYTTIVRNASFAYEQAVKFVWWLIEHKIGEDVPIWGNHQREDDTYQEKWLDIGPSDVKGYYAVRVVIEPLLPEDDIAQGQHAAAMVQAGLWSKRYARETKMGIPAPEAMDDEILVEQAMEMPQLKMYLLMKALERREMDELAEVFQMTAEMVEQQLLEAAKGGNTQVPGRPGLPNLAPGAGGAGAPMPGANGMMNGGQPQQQPPVDPISPI